MLIHKHHGVLRQCGINSSIFSAISLPFLPRALLSDIDIIISVNLHFNCIIIPDVVTYYAHTYDLFKCKKKKLPPTS